MLNGKVIKIPLIAGKIKKIQYKWVNVKSLGRNVKANLDLPNYATKSDSKDVDISKFAKKVELASLRSEIDKLDIDKLETIPIDLKLDSHLPKNFSLFTSLKAL